MGRGAAGYSNGNLTLIFASLDKCDKESGDILTSLKFILSRYCEDDQLGFNIVSETIKIAFLQNNMK